ncbi:FAD-dependent oxidoreductase [Ruminococcus flavefaciens]|uniref:FAD-dependent oxidoreductase n=1 Tax=Ruminococcus flavefaciens TaxID=1265 RepID=UPI0004900379|nr:FAD-dependent oxidoreductase [Ruminococcus flavefaciens]
MNEFDRIIIGAGLYGLYAALFCCRLGMRVLVLECEQDAFQRATKINQARVHQGYHYPRSLSTAIRSAKYFERFVQDYGFCINSEFQQIYATSSVFSWTNAAQFRAFCRAAEIPCETLHPDQFFHSNMCDSAFLTKEYTYDAEILKTYFRKELAAYTDNCTLWFGVRPKAIQAVQGQYEVTLPDGTCVSAPFVLNASYAGVNQIISMIGGEQFRIKYELCELILCEVNEKLRDIGITVMDGPFFSIMPYGKTGLHSLTAVTFTPHSVCYDQLPAFACQEQSSDGCCATFLGNCNTCPARPQTAYPYMKNLAKKYLLDAYQFTYHSSIFSMKPILMSSEIDDSRPTVIRVHSSAPTFVSVLSGKINTVYDLDEVLQNG